MDIQVCINTNGAGTEMAPLDAQALEFALVLKEAPPAWLEDPVTITAVSLGRDREQLLRRALGMGADRAVWIRGHGNEFSAQERAGCLAREGKTAHLILTGLQSETGMSGSVGPFMGGFLNLPSAMGIVQLDWGQTPWTLVLTQELEGGRQSTLSLQLPGILGIQSGRYSPRYPSLSHMLKAQQQSVVHRKPDPPSDLPPGPVSRTVDTPKTQRRGEDWTSPVQDSAVQFTHWLKQRQLL